MTAKEINHRALTALANQDWAYAQNLFYENVRNNPSHETLNNLGFYLITEGLLCRDGCARNANKLGLKYLLEAAERKASAVTMCAIAKAYDYLIRTAAEDAKDSLYRQAYLYLCKSLEIKYSDEAQYNMLRMQYLMKEQDETILEKARTLVKNYTCRESVSLYFSLLSVHSRTDEGLQCINEYRADLDEVDLLMFYAKTGYFEAGYDLCEMVCSQFAPDQFIAAAVMECCVNTGHFQEAESFAREMKEIEDDIQYLGKESWHQEILTHLRSSEVIRTNIIAGYQAFPPFIDSCCYYGCTTHNINWE